MNKEWASGYKHTVSSSPICSFNGTLSACSRTGKFICDGKGHMRVALPNVSSLLSTWVIDRWCTCHARHIHGIPRRLVNQCAHTIADRPCSWTHWSHFQMFPYSTHWQSQAPVISTTCYPTYYHHLPDMCSLHDLGIPSSGVGMALIKTYEWSLVW